MYCYHTTDVIVGTVVVAVTVIIVRKCYKLSTEKGAKHTTRAMGPTNVVCMCVCVNNWNG